MSGSSLPVLNVDIDDSKLKRMEDVIAKFTAGLAIGPSGNPLPTAPSSPTVPKKKPADKPPDSSFDKFLKKLNKDASETLKTFGLINKTLGVTTDVLKGLFSTTITWGVRIAALSVGGAFGYDMLARHVSDQYRSAQGLNMSVGQTQAAHSVYGTRFSGTGNILQSLAAAQHDPQSAGYRTLLAMGINPQDDVATNLPKVFAAVSEKLKQYKNTGVSQSVLNSYGFGSLGFDVATSNQVAANSGDMDSLSKQYQSRSKTLDSELGVSTSQSYQALNSTFSNNADQIENTFLRQLSKLNGPLGRISDELTKDIDQFISGPNGKAVFDEVSGGLKKLGDWLSGDQFQTDLKSFADCVTVIVHALGDSIKWIAEHVPGVDLSGTGKTASDVNPILPWYGGKFLGGQLPGANPVTNKYTGTFSEKDVFNGSGKGYKMPASQQAELKADFDQLTKRDHLPLGILGAIVMQESGGNPLAYNKKSGTAGLFQFSTPTAAQYGLSSMDRFDPVKSSDAASRYLSDDLKMYHGDITKTLVQYNGGRFTKKGDLDINKETIEYLLNLLPKIQGGVEQHSGLMNRLQQADSRYYGSNAAPAKSHVTVQLDVKQNPGSDVTVSTQSQFDPSVSGMVIPN